METETAWLIEAEGNDRQPIYLAVTNEEFSWTNDSLQALRFATEATALRIMMTLRHVDSGLFPKGQIRITEHQWG